MILRLLYGFGKLLKLRRFGVSTVCLLSAVSAIAGIFDGWDYRARLTFSQPMDGVVSNFPLLVRLENIPGFNYADVLSGGADLRFANADETVALDYEVEQFSEADGSYIWVHVPRIAGTNDFIHAYWGKVATAPPSTTNGVVWSNDYRLVYHLDRTNSIGRFPDAALKGPNGVNTACQRTTGMIAGAQDLTGTRHIDVTGLTSANQSYTFSFWMKTASASGDARIIDIQTGRTLIGFSAGLLRYYDVNAWRTVTGPLVNNNQWRHVAVVYRGAASKADIYIDGALATGDLAYSPRNLGASSRIGATYGTTTQPYDGLLDEFRIAEAVRSPSYIKASWLSQASNDVYISYGSAFRLDQISIEAWVPGSITPYTAVAQGRLQHAGGAENPTIYLCWGASDAGTLDPNDWDNNVSLGNGFAPWDTIEHVLTGLPAGTSYFYRFYAENSTGSAWSESVQAFTTYHAWYVASTGDETDGKSWDTAFTNIQDALDVVNDRSMIFVKGETFARVTSLNWSGGTDVMVRGGYAGNTVGGLPGDRAVDLTPTVITRAAGATTRLIYVNGASLGVLDGVTLTDGYVTEQYGAGLYVNNSTLTVTNCVIRANRINHASASGAGLAVIGGGVHVTESVIDLNITQGGTHPGSGIFLNGGTHVIEYSVIANNYSRGTSSGDGIYVNGTANVVVFNSLITGNHRDGVHQQTAGGVVEIRNSTITGHSRYGVNRVAGTVSVNNSIVWGNNADLFGTVTASYCLLGAGTAGIGSNGNITGDPLFECGLYLGNGSPAINAGSGTAGLSGLAGRTTRLSGAVDDAPLDIGYHFIPGIPAGAANRYAAYDSGLADIYVSPTGDDGNGGMTAGDAFRSITRALAVAGTGSRIHVAAGNYTNGVETFPIQMTRYGVQLLGAGAGSTVVNAAGSGTRALQTIGLAGGGARIEGITFTGGSVGTTTAYSSYLDDHFGARRGGGLNLVNSVMVLEGLVVTNNNVSPGGNDAAFGGGIYTLYSGGIMTNVLVADNRLTVGGTSSTGNGYGGGLSLIKGQWLIADSVISNNHASINNNGGNQGGGVYMTGSHHLRQTMLTRNRIAGAGGTARLGGAISMTGGTVERCTIHTNWMTTTTSASARGGGIYMTGGIILNSLLTRNYAIRDGGGIYATGGRIESATVAGNRTIESGFIAGVFLSGATVMVTNSIFAHNYRDFDGVDISVSGTGGGVAYSVTEPAVAGTGNTGVDPEFMNYPLHDYRLRPGSPAIDSAIEKDWMAGSSDIDGNSRIQNSTPDRGCYESEPPDQGPFRINFIADKSTGIDSLSVIFTAHVEGSDISGLNYQWDFDNNGTFDLEGSARQVVTNLYLPGVHAVRLRVTNAGDGDETLIKTAYIYVSSTTIYVSPDGDNSDGLSWATAFNSIQAAINFAGLSNTIHVAGGTYNLTASLIWSEQQAVNILGGYEADTGTVGPGPYDSAQWPTLIQRSSGSIRVLDINSVTGCLERVTIANGNTLSVDASPAPGSGGGIRIQNSNLEIADCIISNNTANTGGNGHVWGGGVYIVNSTVNILRTSFAGNKAKSTPGSNNNRAYGGGLAASGSVIAILDSEFHGNDADAQGHHGSWGGAIYLIGGSGIVSNTAMIGNRSSPNRADRGYGGALYLNAGTTVERCVIQSNRVWNAADGYGGGGVYMTGGTLRNCLVADNQASWDGGGIFATGGRIENVTVAGNLNSEANRIPGVYLSGATVTVTNSIFSANIRTFDSAEVNVTDSGGTIAYSCMTPGRAGTSNLTADAEFVDTATSNYRLLPSSPAVDTAFALGWMTDSVDLDGNPRIRNDVPDMGCYEAAPPGEGPIQIGFTADRQTGLDSLDVVFTASVAGSNLEGLQYQWDFDNDGTFDLEGSDRAVVTNVFTPGRYAVRLRVTNEVEEVAELIRDNYIFVSASEIYVWSGGDDSDGLSWATAFHEVQPAIDFAAVSNTIYLAGETFLLNETLVWAGHQKVRIQGGYQAGALTVGPGLRDSVQWPTRLVRNPAAGNLRILYVSSVSNCLLEQVVVANGLTTAGGETPYSTGSGGGIRLLASELDITDCVISNNQANATGNGYAWGGGVFAQDSTVVFRRTRFLGNIARNTSGSSNSRSRGGGLAAAGGAITILESHFLDNDADAYGHHGSHGGAICLDGGNHLIRNTLMAGNRAGPNRALGVGGAIYLTAGTTMENCTIATNRIWNATAGSGGGIYHAGGSVTNCIITDNWNITTGTRTDIYTANTTVFGYTCSPDLVPGVNGNITSDPLYANPAAGDFTLLPTSPCLDAGVQRPWMNGAVDLNGAERVRGNQVDMGCYEIIIMSGGSLYLFR